MSDSGFRGGDLIPQPPKGTQALITECECVFAKEPKWHQYPFAPHLINISSVWVVNIWEWMYGNRGPYWINAYYTIVFQLSVKGIFFFLIPFVRRNPYNASRTFRTLDHGVFMRGRRRRRRRQMVSVSVDVVASWGRRRKIETEKGVKTAEIRDNSTDRAKDRYAAPVPVFRNI